MPPTSPDTDALLAQAAAGQPDARGALLARHRHRLACMIACRLDRRLASRLDASDVVQVVLALADRKLDRYLHEQPLPFYPWLRQLAWEHLPTLHRRHVRAETRTIRYEDPGLLALPEESAADLAGVRDEASLAQLPEPERQAWRKLWAEVEATLVRASRSPPSQPGRSP